MPPTPTASAPAVAQLARCRPPVSVATLLDIAAGLATGADLPALAAEPLASPEDRPSVRLLATDTYEAWLLRWPPSSSIEPHDHGDAHGAFVVVAGELIESRWYQSRRHGRRLRAGDSSVVRLGAVHDVAAAGIDAAYSVHVYSPPLRTMRFYDDAGRRVTAIKTFEDGVEARAGG